MFKFASDIVSAVSHAECEKLAELAEGKLVLELGCHFGRSTVALASVAKLVHAIDWHKGDMHSGIEDSAEIFLRNITRYKVREKIVHHMGRFEDVLPLFIPGVFDLAFIDALHTAEAVKADAQAVLPLLKPGGTMAFHDYGRHLFGVTGAVDEFSRWIGRKVQVTESVAVITL
jgi:predicted O-methyltransferase YrrM